jgi:hypothetical protein
MGTRTDTVADLPSARVRQPAGTAIRSRLGFIPYGIAMGPVTTAIGALVAERWGGAARLAVWGVVTAVLAVAAVVFAEPALGILGRLLRRARSH